MRSVTKNKPRSAHARCRRSGDDVVRSLHVRRDDENAKCFPSVLPRVLAVPLGCGVGENLTFQTGLPQVAAIDRHRSSVALNEKGAEPAIWITDGEGVVGRDPEVMHVVIVIYLRPHHPRLLSPTCVLRRDREQLLGLEDLEARALADSALQRHPHVRDGQRVVDELAAGEIILARPVGIGGIDAVLDQQADAAIAKRVDNRF